MLLADDAIRHAERAAADDAMRSELLPLPPR